MLGGPVRNIYISLFHNGRGWCVRRISSRCIAKEIARPRVTSGQCFVHVAFRANLSLRRDSRKEDHLVGSQSPQSSDGERAKEVVKHRYGREEVSQVRNAPSYYAPSPTLLKRVASFRGGFFPENNSPRCDGARDDEVSRAVVSTRFFSLSIPATRIRRARRIRERVESLPPTVRTIRFPRHSLQYRIKANCCAYRPSGPLLHACGLQMSDGGSQLRKIMTSVTQSRLRVRVCVTPSFRDGRPSPSDPSCCPLRFNRVRGSEHRDCGRMCACVVFFATFGLFQRCD